MEQPSGMMLKLMFIHKKPWIKFCRSRSCSRGMLLHNFQIQAWENQRKKAKLVCLSPIAGVDSFNNDHQLGQEYAQVEGSNWYKSYLKSGMAWQWWIQTVFCGCNRKPLCQGLHNFNFHSPLVTAHACASTFWVYRV